MMMTGMNMHCLLLLQVVLTSAKETTSRVEGKAVAMVRGVNMALA
jgi:hypothetical protein